MSDGRGQREIVKWIAQPKKSRPIYHIILSEVLTRGELGEVGWQWHRLYDGGALRALQVLVIKSRFSIKYPNTKNYMTWALIKLGLVIWRHFKS